MQASSSTPKFVFLLLLILYANHYLLTLGEQTILGDDSYIGLLDREPNIMLSVSKEGKQGFGPFAEDQAIPVPTGFHRSSFIPNLFLQLADEKIPLMFQDRQGGLAFYFFKHLTRAMGLKWAILAQQLFIGVGILCLFFALINRLFDSNVAVLASLYLCLDPVFVFLYAPFISEGWMLIIVLLMAHVYLGSRADKKLWIGLLVAVGFYVKISFLWFVAALVPFVWERRRTDEMKHMLVNSALFSLPVFFLYDFRSLFERYSSQLMDATKVAHYPLREFYNLIAGKSEYLQFLARADYSKAAEGLGLSFWGISPWGLGLLALVLWPLVKLIRARETNRRVFSIYLSMLIFFMLAWVSLPRSTYYAEYLFPLCLPVALLFGLGTRELHAWLSAKKPSLALPVVGLVVTMCLVGSCYPWFVEYRKNGPLAVYDLSFMQNLTHELTSRGVKRPYINDDLLTGKLELLSKGKLNPTHTYAYSIRRNLYNTAHLLKGLKSGEMLYTLNDHSTPRGSRFDASETPGSIRAMALANKTRIYAERTIYRRGQPVFWYFKFENNK